MLYVDVNISEGLNERIVIYDGDKSEEIVDNFALAHGIKYYFNLNNYFKIIYYRIKWGNEKKIKNIVRFVNKECFN